LVDAFRVVALGSGVVDEAEVEGSTGDGVPIVVCIEFGDVGLGTRYPAVEGAGFARTAERLLVPLMIKTTATASTIAAPRISPRRAQ